MKELGSDTAYNTHNTTSLIHTLKYVSDILQMEEVFMVEEYRHTHTHTQPVTMGDPATMAYKLACSPLCIPVTTVYCYFQKPNFSK